jgi:hypothetical protein
MWCCNFMCIDALSPNLLWQVEALNIAGADAFELNAHLTKLYEFERV